jgi:hypothetical protein
MTQPVQFESDSLRAEVWPQFGGRVGSLVDKADEYELLFSYPAELPSGGLYDASYIDAWHAGWDECFPAVAACKYVGHPYDEIPVPEHGEIWGLPTTAVPSRAGITTVWHGLRFGYRLTRKLRLEENGIVAEYVLINLAPFDFHFVWSQHPLLAMEVPMRVELPGLAEQGGEGGLDFSNPASLPTRQLWRRFSQSPIAEPVRIVYPSRHRQLEISYSSSTDLPAYWGIWLNTGGWAGHRSLAISPITGRADALRAAIADRSAGVVGPMDRADWTVRWTVSPA